MEEKDCREYAKRCIELANNAQENETQSMLLELAQAWTTLADELDKDASLKAAVGAIDISKPSPSRQG